MIPFLEQVAAHYYPGPDIAQTCFLFPNRRSLVFFKKYLAALVKEKGGGVPLPVPPLYTVNDFFYRLNHVEVTDKLRLLLELYAVYKNLNPQAEPLDEFVFWGDVMLSDFDDIDKYLVNARALLQNVEDFKALQDGMEYLSENQRQAIEHFLSHFRDADMGRVKAQFVHIWNLLYPIYRDFNKTLKERNLAYEGMVYRPPSEAYSLIIQVTIGCSHNKCRFCSMYKDKQFHIRQLEDILADLRECRAYYSRVKRIFLADGDALCLSNAKLLAILEAIRELFPECERVGVYGRATDILRKSPEELAALREAGIGIVYVGAESGNPEVLARMCKRATREELIAGVRRAEDAGIAASVSFISGLGGRELWKEHAVDSATMISEMHPSYASWLTLMLDPSAPVTQDIAEGRFELLKPAEVLEEMDVMLSHIDMPEGSTCVFRLSLKGDLPKDKERMLAVVRQAKENRDMLRPEFWRAL